MLVRCSTNAAVVITTSHTTLRTILQVELAAGRQGKLLAWGISGNGISASAVPIDVHLLLQSTDGTPAGDGLEVRWNPEESGTISAVAKQGIYSAEPTAGDILERVWVPTSGPGIQRVYGTRDAIEIGTAGHIAIAGISHASSEQWDAHAWMLIDE